MDFQNHGGLAFIHRRTISFRKKQHEYRRRYQDFRILVRRCEVQQQSLCAAGRLTARGSQPLSAVFFVELSFVFEQLAARRCPVVVCGDFNIYVDQVDHVYAVRFTQLLKSFDCIQHVSESTHAAGHILDLVIIRKDTGIRNVLVGGVLSDHALVQFTLPLEQSRPVNCRAWRECKR